MAGLRGERARGEIAREANFERDAPRGEEFGERGIAHRGDAVADAFRAEQLDGFAHGFRRADFSGMANRVQGLAAGKVEGGAEIHSGVGQFVAAHAEGDDAGTTQAGCPASRFHGGFVAELARGVENPGDSETAEGSAFGRLADDGEIFLNVLHAAQHHAGREGDFRAHDILAQEFGRESSGDEGVILRIAQEGSDPFEGLDESGEGGKFVARGDFFGCELLAVTRRQFHGRFRADGTFQVQVKLGLGEGANDRALRLGCGHRLRLIEAAIAAGRR